MKNASKPKLNIKINKKEKEHNQNNTPKNLIKNKNKKVPFSPLTREKTDNQVSKKFLYYYYYII